MRFRRLTNILDSRAQFHQCSTYSFYARRSRMRKKDSQVSSVIWHFWDLRACKKRQSSQQCHLALLGHTSVKAARKTLVKLTIVLSPLVKWVVLPLQVLNWRVLWAQEFGTGKNISITLTLKLFWTFGNLLVKNT